MTISGVDYAAVANDAAAHVAFLSTMASSIASLSGNGIAADNVQVLLSQSPMAQDLYIATVEITSAGASQLSGVQGTLNNAQALETAMASSISADSNFVSVFATGTIGVSVTPAALNGYVPTCGGTGGGVLCASSCVSPSFGEEPWCNTIGGGFGYCSCPLTGTLPPYVGQPYPEASYAREGGHIYCAVLLLEYVVMERALLARRSH